MITFIDRSDLDITSQGNGWTVGEAQSSVSGLISPTELCGFFDGINTVLDFLGREMPTAEQERSSEQNREGDFNTFGTYGEAFDTYRHHPAKVRKFVEADAELTDEDAAGIAVSYGITGDFLDIGRYLEGEPEAFGSMSLGNPRGRRVNLLFNIDAVWSMDVETINERGRRMQRLVDWLESKQVRTMVTAVSSAGCAHVEIVVKDHDEVLDINDIAIVGHGDFFRRMMFRFMEYSPRWSGGYGHAYRLAEYLNEGDAKPDDSQELTVFVSNRIDDVKHVRREFDRAEKELAHALGSSWIEDHNRVIRLFKGE